MIMSNTINPRTLTLTFHNDDFPNLFTTNDNNDKNLALRFKTRTSNLGSKKKRTIR